MNIIVSFGLVKINIGRKIKKTEMKLRLFIQYENILLLTLE